MHGVGRLTSLNGDTYEGQFENHEYHGLGRFTKRGGDTYIGKPTGQSCLDMAYLTAYCASTNWPVSG